MSFRAGCKGICYRIPIGIVLTVCAFSILLSMLCGCFIPINRMGVCLPRFSLPVVLLSLLLILVHMLLVIDALLILTDNIRCKNNVRKLITVFGIFLLSALGFNLIFRVGLTVLAAFCFGLSMVLCFLYLFDRKKRYYTFTVPVCTVMIYFFIISIFAY